MAATLREQLGINAELIEGGGGIFDVTVDGTVVFSKHEQGRFPEHDEVVSAIQSKQG